MKTSSPSSLPKLLAASAVAALVALSTATVANAARHEDPWNPNSWVPGAIGGAVGGVVVLILYRNISRDIRESAKEIKESANNARKLTQAVEDILDKIKRN